MKFNFGLAILKIIIGFICIFLPFYVDVKSFVGVLLMFTGLFIVLNTCFNSIEDNR